MPRRPSAPATSVEKTLAGASDRARDKHSSASARVISIQTRTNKVLRTIMFVGEALSCRAHIRNTCNIWAIERRHLQYIVSGGGKWAAQSIYRSRYPALPDDIRTEGTAAGHFAMPRATPLFWGVSPHLPVGRAFESNRRGDGLAHRPRSGADVIRPCARMAKRPPFGLLTPSCGVSTHE